MTRVVIDSMFVYHFVEPDLRVETLYFHRSIIEFRIEEKIHTKAVVEVYRGAGGRVLLFSLERLGRGY